MKSVGVRVGAEPVDGSAPVRVRVRTRDFGQLRGVVPLRARRARRRALPGLVAVLAAARPARRRERPPQGARAPRAAPDPGRRRQPPGGRADDGPDHRHPARGRRARLGPAGALRPAARRPPRRRAALRQAADQARRRQARPRAAHHALAAPAARRHQRARRPARRRRRDPPAHGPRARHGRHRRERPAAAGLDLQDHHALGRADARDREPVERLSGADRHDALRACALANASNESCGGSLANSFAHSCNSVFAPLGAKLGRKRLVRLAEAYGFNEKPRLPTEKPSTIARDLQGRPRGRLRRDRPGARPRHRGPDGLRGRDDRQPRGADAPARGAPPSAAGAGASSRARSPRQVRDMMVGVVRGGTGGAAALPGRRRGRQDRHRRAAPDRRRRRSTPRTPTPGSSRSRPPTTRRSRSP